MRVAAARSGSLCAAHVASSDPLFGVRGRVRRRGLSLLEVIIALAVLAGSTAVIAQMIEMAVRRSSRSEERMEAATLCNNLMNELVSGVRPWQNMTSPQPVDLFSPWDYQVTVEPLAFADLAALTVVVSRRDTSTSVGSASPTDGAMPTNAPSLPASTAADGGTDGVGTLGARDRRPTWRATRWVRAAMPAPGRSAGMGNSDGLQGPDAGGLLPYEDGGSAIPESPE